MDPAGQRPRAEKTLRHAPATEDLIDYCSRPMCRKEFRRAVAPGRRQEYCSEVCRRTAERELRQARSRLAHFEDLVQKLRTDVAAFGRSDVADGDVEQSPLMASDLTAAEYAVNIVPVVFWPLLTRLCPPCRSFGLSTRRSLRYFSESNGRLGDFHADRRARLDRDHRHPRPISADIHRPRC